MAIKTPLTMAIKAPLTMAARGMELLERFDTERGAKWRETMVHVIFGAFVGSLALLLILLYAGVPIVGGA
jgi:hypothetical protein